MMEKCKEYLKNNFSNGPKAKKILAINAPLFFDNSYRFNKKSELK